jgi:thioredoxin-related protein
MSHAKRFHGLFVALLLASPVLLEAAEGWETDWQAAKKKAEKEGKDLLIDFTGSDWCGWCIRLKKEVFQQQEFQAEAPKHFVLVELDFPRGKKLDPKLKAQNDGLQAKFGIQGFPTVILADSKGRAYARTGYQPGGSRGYLQHLAEARAKKAARDKLLAEADEAAEELEKVRRLDRVLSQLERDQVLVGYGELIARILLLDPKNEAGLKTRYERLLQRDLFQEAKMHYESGEMEKVLPLLEKAREVSPKSQEGEIIAKIIEQLKQEKPKAEASGE